MKNLIIFLFWLACVQFYAQENTSLIAPEDLAIIVGEWTGTLTYADYSSGKPFSMSANLNVTKGKNKHEIVLNHIYPNEPKANSSETIKMSKDGLKLNKKDIVSRENSPEGQLTIISKHKGKDNKQKALIRNTYILSENKFEIKKEVQFDNTKEWIVRNVYEYVK